MEVTVTTKDDEVASLDPDNHAQADLFTDGDGVLIARYLEDSTGENLISGALGPGARGTPPDDIAAHLNSMADRLDVDANCERDVFTDGILIARFLAGQRHVRCVEFRKSFNRNAIGVRVTPQG